VLITIWDIDQQDKKQSLNHTTHVWEPSFMEDTEKMVNFPKHGASITGYPYVKKAKLNFYVTI
jgi:hypothetical protein